MKSKIVLILIFNTLSFVLFSQNANTYSCPKDKNKIAFKVSPEAIRFSPVLEFDSIGSQYDIWIKEVSDWVVYARIAAQKSNSEINLEKLTKLNIKADSLNISFDNGKKMWAISLTDSSKINAYITYQNNYLKIIEFRKAILDVDTKEGPLSAIPLIGTFNNRISPEVKFIAKSSSLNTSAGIYTGNNQNETKNSFALFNPAVSNYGISVSGFQPLTNLLGTEDKDFDKYPFLKFFLQEIGLTYNMDFSNKSINMDSDSIFSVNQFIGNIGVEIQFLDIITVFAATNFNDIVTDRSKFKEEVRDYDISQKYYNIGADFLLGLEDGDNATRLNINMNLIVLNGQMRNLIERPSDMLMPVFNVALRRSL